MLWEEIYVVMMGLKQSYTDAMKMPIMERRFFLEQLKQQNQKRQEELDEPKEVVTSTGKGTRTVKRSGKSVS